MRHSSSDNGCYVNPHPLMYQKQVTDTNSELLCDKNHRQS